MKLRIVKTKKQLKQQQQQQQNNNNRAKQKTGQSFVL